MSPSQIIGIVVLVMGAVLICFGYTASRGVGESVDETFTGHFTRSTIWYFVFGAIAALGLIPTRFLKRNMSRGVA